MVELQRQNFARRQRGLVRRWLDVAPVVSDQSVVRAEPHHAAGVFGDGVDAVGRQPVKERHRAPSVQVDRGVVDDGRSRRDCDGRKVRLRFGRLIRLRSRDETNTASSARKERLLVRLELNTAPSISHFYSLRKDSFDLVSRDLTSGNAQEQVDNFVIAERFLVLGSPGLK